LTGFYAGLHVLWLILIPLIASAVIIVSGWGLRSAGSKIEASLQRFPPEAPC
jgi:hypothetical protein